MMRWASLLCVVVVALAGCAGLDDYHYCLVNHRRADSAWKRFNKLDERAGRSAHYALGWKHGYFDVSTGGNGEPPPVPPSKYWAPRYQSQSGQAAIEEWFIGFQDGATAAESSGTGTWHPIYTGPTVPVTPMGWPVVEVFPADAPDAKSPEPLPIEQPQPVEPNQQALQWPIPQSILQEPAPNRVEAIQPLEASRRFELPMEETHAVPPVFTDE